MPKYYKFESRLRVKWPQKGAHPPNSPKGPALPGESTPRTFDIHNWMKATATKHQKLPGGLPAIVMEGWNLATDAKTADDLRPVLERCAAQASGPVASRIDPPIKTKPRLANTNT
eukprot:6651501-Pyramimonas_sp.AAC.2